MARRQGAGGHGGGGPAGDIMASLRVPHTAMQRRAVEAFFRQVSQRQASAASQHEGLSEPDLAAIRVCLMHSSPSVVEEAVKGLCQSAAASAVAPAQGLREVIAVLSTIPAEAAPAVVTGIGALYKLQLSQSASTGASQRAYAALSHPFTMVLRSQEDGHLELLRQVAALVPMGPSACLALRPFFLSALLAPTTIMSPSASSVFFASSLHLLLCQLATSSEGASANLLLQTLIRILPLYGNGNPIARGLVIAAVDAVVDAMATFRDSAHVVDELQPVLLDMEQELLSCTLLNLCHDFRSQKAATASLLACTARSVSKLRPSSQEPLLLTVVGLLLTTEEESGMLKLLRLVSHMTGSLAPFLRAAAVFPSIQAMALPSPHLQTSASGLVRRLGLPLGASSITPCNKTQPNEHKHLQHLSHSTHRLCESLQGLLARLWQGVQCKAWWEEKNVHTGSPAAMEALGRREVRDGRAKGSHAEAWLNQLSSYLRVAREQAVAAAGRRTISSGVNLPAGVVELALVLVTALALHPLVAVQLAAAKTFAAIGAAEPMWGISLLPLILFCLSITLGSRPEQEHPNEGDTVDVVADERRPKMQKSTFSPPSQLVMLEALPATAGHPATVGPTLRAIQQFLVSSSWKLMAVGLRLLCKAWQHNDRVFLELRKALEEAAGAPEPAVQLAVASCIYDICNHDSGRGVEVVLLIKAGLKSKANAILALSLQSIALLCQQDALDFYTAWKAVSAEMPMVPQEPFVAACYCSFLRFGALDSAAHPSVAGSIMQVLWAQVRHDESSKEVSAAAASALAAYELAGLEDVFLLPFAEVVDVWLSDKWPLPRPEIEKLVVKCFLYDDRKLGRGAALVQVSALKRGHKLLQAVPLVLSHQTPHIAPEAELLMFDPPTPQKTEGKPGPGIKRAYVQALRSRDKSFGALFKELVTYLRWSGPDLGPMASWSTFFMRWIKCRAALLHAEGIQGQEGYSMEETAAESLWLEPRNEAATAGIVAARMLALASLATALPSSIAREAADWFVTDMPTSSSTVESILGTGLAGQKLSYLQWRLKVKLVEHLSERLACEEVDAMMHFAAGLSLGWISQSLLLHTSEASFWVSEVEEEAIREETALLATILDSLLAFLGKWDRRAPCLLTESGIQTDSMYRLPRHTANSGTQQLPRLVQASLGSTAQGAGQDKRDDASVVGAVCGLGLAAEAVGRAGDLELLRRLLDLLIQLAIPEQEGQGVHHCGGQAALQQGAVRLRGAGLASGAVQALPACVAAASKYDLISGAEVDGLLTRMELLVEGFGTDLWSPGIFSECGLKVAPASAIGGLLHTALCHGHSVASDVATKVVKTLVKLFKDDNKEKLLRGAAMTGFAQAIGATTDFVALHSKRLADVTPAMSQVTRGRLLDRLLSEPLMQEEIRVGVQALIEVYKEESELREEAGRALALCSTTYSVWRSGVANETDDAAESGAGGLRVKGILPLESFPAEGTLRPAIVWLLQSSTSHVDSVTGSRQASVLRCLSQAPRLPSLAWGKLLHRLMRQHCLYRNNGDLSGAAIREECILFAMVQADRQEPPAVWLAEILDLTRLFAMTSRERVLVARHLPQLLAVFSVARSLQLLHDLGAVLVDLSRGAADSATPPDGLDASEEREAVWMGLHRSLEDVQLSASLQLVDGAERLMRSLIAKLPLPDSSEEWRGDSECEVAVEAMRKLKAESLQALLQVRPASHLQSLSPKEVATAMFLRARLVAHQVLPPMELQQCVHWLVDEAPAELELHAIELARALRGVGLVDRRRWLASVLDIALLCRYPDVAVLLLSLLASAWAPAAMLLQASGSAAVGDLPYALPCLLTQEDSVAVALAVQKVLKLLRRLQDGSASCQSPFLDHDCIFAAVRGTLVALRSHLSLEELGFVSGLLTTF
eukprot:SM000097S24798  [mRNA]  locus=s97:283471:295374:+ [translate_table: standard]